MLEFELPRNQGARFNDEVTDDDRDVTDDEEGATSDDEDITSDDEDTMSGVQQAGKVPVPPIWDI